MLEDFPTFLELSEVIWAKNYWEEEEKPSPNPRYYDSVNEEETSEFESASDESSDEEGPPKLIKIASRMKRENSSSSSSSSESGDCQSDSSIKSKIGKSRQQVDKRIKDVSKQCEGMNENIGNFEGRLVAIECNVSNISEDLDSVKKMHKSSNSALKNTVETESKIVREDVSVLRNKLEKSQEMSIDLDTKLCKSQFMQKESNDKLEKLQ